MVGQWVVSIGMAVWLSPMAWAGKTRVIHSHVFAAVILGGIITVLPVALALMRPGEQLTRYMTAAAQVLFSGLLIHLSGGRLETHFHIFGSLAIIAFYRDVKVLLPATVIVAADHFLRGVYWPESIFGIANPEWWRFLEHAGWVVFIDVFLITNCVSSYSELKDLLKQHIALEDQQDQLMRVEKLAAVGQLAASVGHELRNPLSAVRNAHTYMNKRLAKEPDNALATDPKIQQFMGLMVRELDAATGIISDLLEFSRIRDASRSPCPVHALVDEVIELVPESAAKIFQPLFSTKTKGTGLGLAVVAGIVEKHGGTLSVDSIVGQGTTFTAVVPQVAS